MPHPEAAAVIANQLHELTTDDGTVLRDNHLIPSTGMPQAWHDDMAKIREGKAQGIVNAIEAAGGTIVMPGDVEPPPPPPAHWVDVHCTSCHNVLFKVNLVAPDVNGHHTITAMHNLDPACPHHEMATRP